MITRWKCVCGNEQLLEDRFCAECGNELPEYVEDQVIKEELMEMYFGIKGQRKTAYVVPKSGRITCPYCKKKILCTSIFCPGCGNSINLAGLLKGKSRDLAGLLGIFFGSFGIHNFYLGYYKKGVMQLSIRILALIFQGKIGAIFTFGVGIWGLAEGIMVLSGIISMDGYGVLINRK